MRAGQQTEHITLSKKVRDAMRKAKRKQIDATVTSKATYADGRSTKSTRKVAIRL